MFYLPNKQVINQIKRSNSRVYHLILLARDGDFNIDWLIDQPVVNRSGSLVFAVWACIEDLVEIQFHQSVMFALDLDQWQLTITGKVPQHHDGSVSGVGMSSLDTGRMEMLKGTFLTPSGFAR